MKLFKLNPSGVFSEIAEAQIAKERTLQQITDKNLSLIFGLEFVCSEFTVGDFRIDTLAFDPETRSFVIIEYKRSESRSVIDQGYAYLGKMLDRKADFVLEYNSIKKKAFQLKDIDWGQSRVLFVSTAFNTYQIGSLIFNDLPISLWEVKSYKDGLWSYRKIDHSGSGASIKTLANKDPEMNKVYRQVMVYSEADHLQKGSDETREIYENMRDAILQRWKLTIEPKKLYIAFKDKTNVVDIEIQKKQLKLILNVPKGKLNDNMGITEDIAGKGKWGNGDYQVIMQDDSNMAYVLSLIEQSYKYGKGR
ncbi:MAG: DUF5655 domain-containing protein [Candidatus Cloacimonetes bacterium]|nr:DUF5655 domain-containing protein [Candidatus Cloacimonadota bacterium]